MSSIDDLLDGFIRFQYDRSPATATMHGRDGWDDRLPDLSEANIRQRDQEEDRWAQIFAAFADGDLTFDERIDRDLVLSHLRGRAILRDWEGWRREPERYLEPGLMGVFSLFLRRLHPEPDLVRFAVSRLEQVPALLSAARESLDATMASKVMVDRGAKQCRSAVTYARQLVPAEVDDGDLRAQLAAAGESAAAAYEDFASWLDDFSTRANGDWAIGEARYSALLRDKELLGDDAAALQQRGRDAYDDLAADMADLAKRMQGTDDWRRILSDLGEDRPQSPEEMREGYERATAAARQYLVDHELVTFPEGEDCVVVPSPPFQRPVLAVASYFQPPAFRPGLVGRFNVPFPPDGTSDEEIGKRLADNNYPSMPTTSVHEAYPGHHWHYARLQSGARPIRRVLSTPYFTEGWALYAERMMREQGFFAEPAHELFHLEARLFRAARIVVDTGLHCGELSFDDAVTFMHEKTKLTEPVARAEVARYCAWPTQAASYLTGSLEIERIRQSWFAADRGSLRQFHDTICASGALPIALGERAVLGG